MANELLAVDVAVELAWNRHSPIISFAALFLSVSFGDAGPLSADFLTCFTVMLCRTDGSRTWMTESGREAALERQRALVKEYCD